MGFKQKGFSLHTGTSSHASALKAAADEKFNMPKPRMSKTSAHGQLNDAKADFKADQEIYNKAMGKKRKTAEDYMNEGFSQREADQMERDQGVSGEVDAPNKFLSKEAKAGRAERKKLRQAARKDRKEARKERRTKNQAEKTARLKSKLEARTKKASMSKGERKAARDAKVAEKSSSNTNAVSKDTGVDKKAVRRYKMNKGIHDFTEGMNAVLYGRSMKEYDGTDPRNKLAEKNNQNKTLGTKSGTESKAKTSREAQLKKDIASDKKFIKDQGDAMMERAKERNPEMYGKSKAQKAREKRAADYKAENDPIRKAARSLMPKYEFGKLSK